MDFGKPLNWLAWDQAPSLNPVPHGTRGVDIALPLPEARINDDTGCGGLRLVLTIPLGGRVTEADASL